VSARDCNLPRKFSILDLASFCTDKRTPRNSPLLEDDRSAEASAPVIRAQIVARSCHRGNHFTASSALVMAVVLGPGVDVIGPEPYRPPKAIMAVLISIQPFQPGE
jgi:hypothetical protein